MNSRQKHALNELHDKLAEMGSDHPELLALQKKTARALESGEHLPIVEELKGSAKKFEVRHPDLTALINNLLNALSGLGI